MVNALEMITFKPKKINPNNFGSWNQYHNLIFNSFGTPKNLEQPPKIF